MAFGFPISKKGAQMDLLRVMRVCVYISGFLSAFVWVLYEERETNAPRSWCSADSIFLPSHIFHFNKLLLSAHLDGTFLDFVHMCECWFAGDFEMIKIFFGLFVFFVARKIIYMRVACDMWLTLLTIVDMTHCATVLSRCFATTLGCDSLVVRDW